MAEPTDLRRRVLDTSAAILASEGVAALSLREVARRAGVSHQAPYKHYADREAVLAALAEEGFTRLADAIEAAHASSGCGAAGAEARLAAAGAAYIRFGLDNPGHFRVLARPDLVPPGRYPATEAAAARAWAALGVAASDVRPDIEPELARALIWSVAHGAAVLLLDGPLPARGSPWTAAALGEGIAATFARLAVG